MKKMNKKAVSLVIETDEPTHFYCPETVEMVVNFGDDLPEATCGEYNLPMRWYPEIRRVVKKVERGQNLFAVIQKGMGAESPFRRRVCRWLDEELRYQLSAQSIWGTPYGARELEHEVWVHPYFVRQ